MKKEGVMLTEPELKKLFDEFPLWLKTKDPDETYEFKSSNNCAFAQYLHEIGYDHDAARVSPSDFTLDWWVNKYPIREDIKYALLYPLGYMGDGHRTFGMLQHSFMVAEIPDVPVLVGPLVAGNL
jgi:hypothetical protein